jgi:cobalt/nickel transport system ATP-binding protein
MDETILGEKLETILETLGIAGLKDRISHHLSGGEKRLAALAGILIMEPELLLLDEPGSFLDPAARRRLLSILALLPQTMLIATHDFDLAARLCTRVMVLTSGRIRADGPAATLLADHAFLEECGL